MRHYPRVYFLVSAIGWELQTFQQKKVFKIGQNLHELSTFPAFVECRFLRGLGRRDCWDVTNVCYFYGFCRSYIRLKPKKTKMKKIYFTFVSHSFHILWNECETNSFHIFFKWHIWRPYQKFSKYYCTSVKFRCEKKS